MTQGQALKAQAMTHCRICGAEGDHPHHRPREMMFGLRETFDYFQCTACGCLQITEIPEDLGRFYPAGYFSFAAELMEARPVNPLRNLVKAKRLDQALGHPSWLGRLALRLLGEPDIGDPWLRDVPLRSDYRMLDVGCGNGQRILGWRHAGFTDVMGIDAFVEAEIHYPNGVKVVKGEMKDFDGPFDFITMVHSFEHMPEQLPVLEAAYRALAPGRYLMIALPLVSCEAWEIYGTDWMSLDAPRHLYLHSEDSLKRLAEKAGFEVREVRYDSSAAQFWGSEQYRRDIPLMDPERSYRQNREGSIFTAEEIAAFEARAKALNKAHRGDRARFYCYKA